MDVLKILKKVKSAVLYCAVLSADFLLNAGAFVICMHEVIIPAFLGQICIIPYAIPVLMFITLIGMNMNYSQIFNVYWFNSNMEKRIYHLTISAIWCSLLVLNVWLSSTFYDIIPHPHL